MWLGECQKCGKVWEMLPNVTTWGHKEGWGDRCKQCGKTEEGCTKHVDHKFVCDKGIKPFVL